MKKVIQKIMSMLNTSNKVGEDQDKVNYALIEKIENYNGHIFDIVQIKELKQSVIMLGQFTITEPMSLNECKRLIDERDWSLIAGTTLAVVRTQEIKRELEQIKKEEE